MSEKPGAGLHLWQLWWWAGAQEPNDQSPPSRQETSYHHRQVYPKSPWHTKKVRTRSDIFFKLQTRFFRENKVVGRIKAHSSLMVVLCCLCQGSESPWLSLCTSSTWDWRSSCCQLPDRSKGYRVHSTHQGKFSGKPHFRRCIPFQRIAGLSVEMSFWLFWVFFLDLVVRGYDVMCFFVCLEPYRGSESDARQKSSSKLQCGLFYGRRSDLH